MCDVTSYSEEKRKQTIAPLPVYITISNIFLYELC